MKGIKLLNNYPLSKNIIKNWFLEQLISSLKTETINDDFKELVRKKGVEDTHIETLIDLNPRSLFDVLDENNVILIISYSENTEWRWNLKDDFKNNFSSRREAEKEGILQAIKALEKQLKNKKKN